MSTTLPSSTINRWTLLLATRAVIVRASTWGWLTHWASASVKTMSSSSLHACLAGRSFVLYICIGEGALASFVYLSCTLRLSPARWDLPIIVSTSQTFLGMRCWGRSSLFAAWGLSTNSLKWPALMSLSISSFRATHLSVLCPISLWKAQFLFISFWALSPFMGSKDLYRPWSVIA